MKNYVAFCCLTGIAVRSLMKLIHLLPFEQTFILSHGHTDVKATLQYTGWTMAILGNKIPQRGGHCCISFLLDYVIAVQSRNT